jgi:hypothetical protein
MTLPGCRLHLFALVHLALMVLLARNAHGQIVYDPEAYRQLADAVVQQTPPVGTKITLRNWQNYRRFLPVGMQAAYSGKYRFRIGAEPEYGIEVAPAMNLTLPRKYLDDTRKYQGQERLVLGPEGGYTLSPLPGGTAGLPFGIDPGEPDLGYKVVYNWWLAYSPRISHFYDEISTLDRYKNVAHQTVDFTFYRLSHLSEPGFPAALPYARGYLNSTRLVMVAPEQIKYNTTLQMWSENPAQFPDFYSFLPSQRHSLRLATTATCKPMEGSDFVQDDIGFQQAHFKVAFLGLKKLLTRIQDPEKGRNPASYDITASFPAWPTPGSGRWEIRDSYVIDLQPLPILGNYCYSHRVVYIDKETWFNVFTEMYDADGKFWKIHWNNAAPVRDGDREVLINPASQVGGVMLDFKDNHVSIDLFRDMTVGELVPRQYQNAEQLAFPGGLQQVLQ